MSKYNVLGTPFREGQEGYIKDLINFALNPNKKYMIFQGNVGIGKSLIAVTASKYLAKKHNFKIYLTSPKNILLDQYQNDYDKYLSVIKGGANYPCLLLKGSCTYENGPCHNNQKMKCPEVKECPYKMAVSQAKTDPIVLTNMHWLLFATKFPDMAPTRDLLIIDEAHSLESILIDFLTITYSSNNLKRLTDILKKVIFDKYFLYRRINGYYKGPSSIISQKILNEIDFSNINEVNILVDSFRSSLVKLKESFEKAIGEVDPAILTGDNLTNWLEASKDAIFLKHFVSKINWYNTLSKSASWICVPEYNEKSKNKNDVVGFTLKPLNAVALAKIILPRIANKVVFMSATIGRKEQFCKDLGVSVEETEYVETGSDFPKEKRPIYLPYVGYFNRVNKDTYLKDAVEKIDKILEKYPDFKGVIHTTTFQQCQYIQEHSKFSSRLLTHTTKTKSDVVNMFINSKNKVLCSPSSREGLDLKNDLCRFQIILKVPWGDLSDKVTQKRMELDPTWYSNEAVKNIEQAYGRGVRSNTDWCDCYILDRSFDRLLTSGLLSRYFREAVIF